jgi:hypothetical protein
MRQGLHGRVSSAAPSVTQLPALLQAHGITREGLATALGLGDFAANLGTVDAFEVRSCHCCWLPAPTRIPEPPALS